jgi:hypothetical protein
MVDAWGLVKTVWVSVCLVGSLTCWRKELRVVPLIWLLACIVMSSVMLSLSLSEAWSSKMANGLLLCLCRWWIGCKRWMLEGVVGSRDVVGVWVGLGCLLVEGQFCVCWRMSPLVMGLALAPLVPAWWAIVVLATLVMEYQRQADLLRPGGAPLMMVCQWCLDLMCLGGEQGEGYHVGSEWLVFVPQKHWWKLGQCHQGQ